MRELVTRRAELRDRGGHFPTAAPERSSNAAHLTLLTPAARSRGDGSSREPKLPAAPHSSFGASALNFDSSMYFAISAMPSVTLGCVKSSRAATWPSSEKLDWIVAIPS